MVYSAFLNHMLVSPLLEAYPRPTYGILGPHGRVLCRHPQPPRHHGRRRIPTFAHTCKMHQLVGQANRGWTESPRLPLRISSVLLLVIVPHCRIPRQCRPRCSPFRAIPSRAPVHCVFHTAMRSKIYLDATQRVFYGLKLFRNTARCIEPFQYLQVLEPPSLVPALIRRGRLPLSGEFPANLLRFPALAEQRFCVLRVC